MPHHLARLYLEGDNSQANNKIISTMFLFCCCFLHLLHCDVYMNTNGQTLGRWSLVEEDGTNARQLQGCRNVTRQDTDLAVVAHERTI